MTDRKPRPRRGAQRRAAARSVDRTALTSNRSAAWVGMASLVLGVLDLLSTVICLQLWVSAADFGAATLAIALFPILDRLGGMTLVSAVVREPDIGAESLSSIFWLGLGVSASVLGVIAIARPAIAMLFTQPIVASLLVAYAARLVVMQVSVVPEALMKRELRYRELSLIRIAASAADTAAKLGFAYAGAHGVPELKIWCFALGPIANTVVAAIGVQLCERWRPRFVVRRAIVVRAARFAGALAGGELLYYAYTSADYLVIGTWFGDSAVGIYRLAYEMVLDVVRLVSMVTAEVAFPTFARLATTPSAVGPQLLRFTRQNLIVLSPVLAFVLIEADDLLAIAYPPLPAAAATAARILCAVGALRTLGLILPAMLAGIGHASRVLVYNLVAAIVLPALFVAAALVAPAHGFVAVAWAWAIGYPIAFAVLLVMALPLAGLDVRRYARAIAGVVGCVAVSLVIGTAARYALPETALVRAIGVGAAILASYLALIARLLGVTPAAIGRGLRSPPAE